MKKHSTPSEDWLDTLLHAEARQEAASLADEAAFSAALLARLPVHLPAPAPAALRARQLLNLLSACAQGIVVALLFLNLPDLLALLTMPPSLDSGGAARLSLSRALPSLTLLALLCWWSWLQWREV